MKSKNYSESIIKVFKKDGFVLSEPDVLLDSNYIIERSGENFRKIMLTFEDDTGKSMCLRPDLTVASCIKYLKDNSKANSKIYYSGQAYRRSKNLKDTNIIALELSISNKIGLNVDIQNSKRNKGKISFEYKDLDQLNKIIDIIKSNY